MFKLLGYADGEWSLLSIHTKEHAARDAYAAALAEHVWDRLAVAWVAEGVPLRMVCGTKWKPLPEDRVADATALVRAARQLTNVTEGASQ